MPSYKTAEWWERKCKGIARVNVQQHEDLSIQAHIPDVWKITIAAIRHDVVKHEAEGKVLAAN